MLRVLQAKKLKPFAFENFLKAGITKDDPMLAKGLCRDALEVSRTVLAISA